MRRQETYMQEPMYRSMFKDIIKHQIQNLIDQLAKAGEESVLLTACLTENVTSDEDIVGSEVGRHFIRNRTDVQTSFYQYCKSYVKNPKMEQTTEDVCQSTPGKRRFNEVNGEDTADISTDNSQSPPLSEMSKRSRSLPLTPVIKIEPLSEVETSQDLKSPAETGSCLYSEVLNVPKGHSKCSLCNYMSKFKANVTRHERSVHRINLDGAPTVTVQYACALCQYKSQYRSNLQRHEKNIHKIESTTVELESRKINQYLGIPSETGEPVSYDMETGHQDHQLDNQPRSENENAGNQSNMDADIDAEEEDNEGYDSQEDGCHICNYCQLMFKTQSTLKHHIDNTHINSTDLRCEICGKVFDNLFNLQGHMIAHNAPKQEVCDCGKAFQYKTSLNRHQRKCEYLRSSLAGSDGSTEDNKQSTESQKPTAYGQEGQGSISQDPEAGHVSQEIQEMKDTNDNGHDMKEVSCNDNNTN